MVMAEVVATTATDLQAVGAVALGEAEVDTEVAMGEVEVDTEVDTEVATEVATVMVHPVEEGGAEAVEAVGGIEGL
jgi:uncharacterized protein (DUF169 family)